MSRRGIHIEVPSEEQIAELEEAGIDVEGHLVRLFQRELHSILHPDDEDYKKVHKYETEQDRDTD